MESSGTGKPSSRADLARMLGVSPASVSYALNGLPGVSAGLRQTIIEAAIAHGIPVPEGAHTDTQPAIGLILADVSNPFYSEMAVTVTDAAREHGFEVFVSHTRDQQDAVADAVAALIRHGVDGVLLTAIHEGTAELFAALRAARIPCVQISRHMSHAKADFVGIDDAAASAELMNHVLDHGYARIALVTGPHSSSASHSRAVAFREVLHRRELRLPREWNLTAGLNEADGAQAARHLLSLRTLPQAVVCGNDAVALGLITALSIRGVRIPEDIAVTGFDGLTTARANLVDLTTVVQPRRQMAVQAMKLLIERQQHWNAPPRDIICPHHIHIGQSCGCTTQQTEETDS